MDRQFFETEFAEEKGDYGLEVKAIAMVWDKQDDGEFLERSAGLPEMQKGMSLRCIREDVYRARSVMIHAGS